MTKTIYIPEGRSGRLTKESADFDINGLFTNEFSSCNILSVIGQNKIALMHLDTQLDYDSVAAEIQWVDEPREIVLIFREAYKQVVTTPLLRELYQRLPNQNIILKKVENDVQGISVSFNAQEGSKVHKQIRLYLIEQQPDELLRHPQEQEIEAVQKISQIIGLRARITTPQKAKIQMVIFDSLSWEPLNNFELKIDDSNPLTKEEMSLFNTQDSIMIIIAKLRHIVENMIKPFLPMKDVEPVHCLEIAFYMQSYLHHFSAIKCLKHDLAKYINEVRSGKNYKPSSNIDIRFCKELKILLLKPEASIEEITKIVAHYEANSMDSIFKKQFMAEYEDPYLSNYYRRMSYSTQQVKYEKMHRTATLYGKQAMTSYREKKFDAAAKLYKNALMLAIKSCLKNNKLLALCFYNTGRSLYHAGRYKEAEPLLQMALALHVHYVKSTTQEVAKAKAALDECLNKLAHFDSIEPFQHTKLSQAN